MKTRWWEKVLEAIALRAVYFFGTVFFFTLSCFYIFSHPAILISREFWQVALALGVLSAFVGPKMYVRHRDRGRGDLREIKLASKCKTVKETD